MLVGQSRDVGNRRPAVGEHGCQIDRDRARIVPATAAAQLVDRYRVLGLRPGPFSLGAWRTSGCLTPQ
jgi:hypothetical protein